MTLLTRGFCCSSGRDMNSSIDNDPEPSRSSFLNLFPSLFISSESNAAQFIGRDASFPIFWTLLFIWNIKNILIWNEKIELYKLVIHSSQSFNSFRNWIFSNKNFFYFYICLVCIVSDIFSIFFLTSCVQQLVFVAVNTCYSLLILSSLHSISLHWLTEPASHTPDMFNISSQSIVNQMSTENLQKLLEYLNRGYIYIYQY